MEGQIQLSRTQKVDEIIKKILRHESMLSYSSLSQFAESPADFIKYKLKEREQTEAMIYGSMVHCLVLQPEDFYNRYFVLDDKAKKEEIGGAKPGATKAYKEWFGLMQFNAGKKTLVTTEDFSIAQGISMGVKYNRTASAIMDLCPQREVGIEWDYLNYKFKGFIDGKGNGNKFDLKTCTDANPKKVRWSIMDMWYYGQAAMYGIGDESLTDNYYIIAVDKKGGVSCHQLAKNLLERGRKEYEYFVNKFSECILSDSFDSSYEFFADRWDGVYDFDKAVW